MSVTVFVRVIAQRTTNGTETNVVLKLAQSDRLCDGARGYYVGTHS